ncbi:MAG: sugar-binding transcriptional regulator [Gammaproteobacteria bacterium]|nr:sugar-binding transcriptional regulator [Gammaproteobacteria bacterium]
MSDEFDKELLDDAARAGWLYYVGGRTQDEIAKSIGVSRQRAQRLVSKAVKDGLIRVSIEHPIAELMDLASRLKDHYGLERVRVAPDLGTDGSLRSVAPFAARNLEGILASPTPTTIGVGTGRALRNAIEQLTRTPSPQHTLVSLIGNIALDGSGNVYEVLNRLAEAVNAPHYPLPAPVFAKDQAESEIYKSLQAVQQYYAVLDTMTVAFIGIGQMGPTAPMVVDGFLPPKDLERLLKQGVAGEICGRPYNHDGHYLETDFTPRMTSRPVRARDDLLVSAIASGSAKLEAIRAAAKGQLINALITDEATARALLD